MEPGSSLPCHSTPSWSSSFQSTTSHPTQLPIQWVPGAISLGVKRQGRELDNSPKCSADVKNAWSYTSPYHYAFMAWC